MTQSVEYRSPRTQDELLDTFSCSHRALGGDGTFFRRIVELNPWFRMENTRACFVDGRAASVVQVFGRRLRIGSSSVRAGCLGSVGTDPDDRGRGYGVGVLHDTDRYLREQGYHLSLFFTSIPRHYAKAGWELHPTCSYDVSPPPQVADPAPHVETARQDGGGEEEAVREIYDLDNVCRTGTILRTPDYWDRRRQWTDPDREALWLSRRRGRVVAYVCERDGNIREMGSLPGDRDALASALRTIWLHRPADVYRVRAGAGHLAAFSTLGCDVQRRENPYLMLRVIDLGGLLEQLAPALEQRLGKASVRPSMSVGFQTEAGACTLLIEAGRVRVEACAERASAENVLRLSQGQLLGLVVGPMTIEQIAVTNRLALDPAARRTLGLLFPPDTFHHWTWDQRMHAE